VNARTIAGITLALIVGVPIGLAAKGDPAGGPTEEAKRMQDIHREMSVSYFNDCWALIDKADRTPEDVENMILLAHASLWHWKQRSDVTPANLSVGYWQASRVHALAGQHEMARYFGDRSLRVGIDNNLPPFYVGYAYEALARAEAGDGEYARARACVAEARKQLGSVTDKEEKALLDADLGQIDKMLPPDREAR
jgi:hypothetical protein